jgi:hypothetical protein
LLTLYASIYNRSFYDGIVFRKNFVLNQKKDSYVRARNKTFPNGRKPQEMNRRFLSGYRFCHEGVHFRPEFGFSKVSPYFYKTRGPYGTASCDLDQKTPSIVDGGFQNIYWVDHNILPPHHLVNLLNQLGWSDKKIDFYVPAWLFDRRLDKYAGKSLRILSPIINQTNTFILNCQWMPLPITRRLIQEGRHVKYCSIVVRLMQLEIIRSELEQDSKNYDFQSGTSESEFHERNRTIHLAINKVMEWQGSMIGCVLYMMASNRFTDEELQEDFTTSKLGTYDEGFHWSIHVGELHNVICLIKSLPFFDPVEKRAQKQRRIRGLQTDAGTVGEMRGTHFAMDYYVKAVMNVLVRAMPQPNKVRMIQHAITGPLREFLGDIIKPAQATEEYIKKKDVAMTKMKEIELLCFDLKLSFKNLKAIVKEFIEESAHDLTIVDLADNNDFKELSKDIIEMIQKLLGYRKQQLIKSWKMNTEHKDYDQLLIDLRAIVERLQRGDHQVNVTSNVISFIGVSPDSIPKIIDKMDAVVRNAIVNKTYSYESELDMAVYASKILTFSDDILKKYLSKDFKDQLLKQIKEELKTIAVKKWTPLNNKNDINLSSSMRRFLRCNTKNIQQIQHEKVANVFKDDDNNKTGENEYSTVIRKAKGRRKQEDIFIPSWSSVAQKKVISGEAKIANLNGGHNAHRFLDFMMRIFSVSLVGGYPNSDYHPSFNTLLEVYKFSQFNYPSIEEFCVWIETLLPFDIKIMEKKNKNGSMSSLLAEKSSRFKKLDIPFKPEALQELYKYIDPKECSQCRRWFLIYLLREHHIFFVEDIPTLHQKLKSIYQWDKICNNISKTMDVIRGLIDDIICDITVHKKRCVPGCKHCKRWKYVCTYFHPKLVAIYRKWPILFAIDWACQVQKKKESSVQTAVAADQNDYFKNKLNFPINNFQSTLPFTGERHVRLLRMCPRPLMRSFAQNAIEQLSEIDRIFSSPFEVFLQFTTEKRRRNVEQNKFMFTLSERAVDEYKNCYNMYLKYTHDDVEAVITEVVSKFPPNAKIGLEWMVAAFKISLESVDNILDAKMQFEKEQSRTKALKVFLQILGWRPRDFFIIRTFFNIVVHYNRIELFPTNYPLMKNTVKSVVKKVVGTLPDDTDTLPDHLVQYWTCIPHGTMQVASVGTELGNEGEKNTKSYGHGRIAVNPYDGKVYCTISGNRLERKEPMDILWRCISTPNIPINMLGRIMQLYDTLYIMCEYCGNVMQYYIERVCAGGPNMWCGQCNRGQKKQAKWLGYQWTSTNSISPCARPIFIGGLPTFVQGCVICLNPRAMPETLKYYLMWIDTDPSGQSFFAYVPVCPSHQRPYHYETWTMSCLSQFTHVSQNYMKSFIYNGSNTQRTFYNAHTKPMILTANYCKPEAPTQQMKEDIKYLLEKEDTQESHKELDGDVVIVSEKKLRRQRHKQVELRLKQMREKNKAKKLREK